MAKKIAKREPRAMIHNKRQTTLEEINDHSLDLFLRKGRDYTKSILNQKTQKIRILPKTDEITPERLSRTIECAGAMALDSDLNSRRQFFTRPETAQNQTTLKGLKLDQQPSETLQDFVLKKHVPRPMTSNINSSCRRSCSSCLSLRNTQPNTLTNSLEFAKSALKTKAGFKKHSVKYSSPVRKSASLQKRETSLQKGTEVLPDECNFEAAELRSYFLPEVRASLQLFEGKPTNEKDIFKSADFWLCKGYLIQTGSDHSKKGVDKNNDALEYYLSGVKINPRSFGCVYNAACCYYMEDKHCNALKWFNLALRLQPGDADSTFGKSVTCLKLGKYAEALEVIKSVDTVAQESSRYKQEQFILLEAICNRLVG